MSCSGAVVVGIEVSTSRRRSASRRLERMRPSTTLTAMRCSQLEKRLSPRKPSSLRQACTNASCVASSASARFAVMRRHSA